LLNTLLPSGVQQKRFVKEHELAELAKAARKKTGLSKAELGRQLGVTRGTIHQAEEYADMSLTRIRLKMIEECTPATISGPFYQIEART
jgi:DNA-binding XRE family transcriptional regulator